ncbi:PREDICTED: uncharacterized protein LOC104783755 [Camelina sativa]|uniref:Uncharacterized protein LOC104783755 n=1 Tax=Camelina sativa TaxID=90675 RepID=A0ABM0YX14_CAMSA|nr:PREDICTED: uncharacterized protein LOC104783755 [Camelina sativa]
MVMGEVPLKLGSQVGSMEKRKGDISKQEGLGWPQDLTVQRLMEMRQKHFPEILFLMETMNIRDVLVDIQCWLGYDHVYTVNPVGRCGGLALFWKKSVEIDFLFVDKNILDLKVNIGSATYFLSCVYGNPNSSLINGVWEKLTRIGIPRKEKWCMIGDFNEILHNGEKLGGPTRSEAYFVDFAEMLKACEVSELSSTEWLTFFPAANQAFLDKKDSDHRPVLVSLVSSQDSYRGSIRLTSVSCTSCWLKNQLKKLGQPLPLFLGNELLKDLEGVERLSEEIEAEHAFINTSFSRMVIIKRDMVVAHKEEEIHWTQKSRKQWLRSGDKNTKYFHNSVKAERTKNAIVKLINEAGLAQKSEASKGDVAARYFQKLFASSYPREEDLQFFQDFVPKVNEEMNELIIADVTSEEVRQAVFSISPSRAPRADGMTGLFFQKYWSVVGEQITKEVLSFFKDGSFDKEWNFTQICLIPKKVNASFMYDLRPISLCSVMYKIISKIMVARLKPFLPVIISPTQSAFVPERLISDNIIIAHEIVHSLRTHEATSKHYMAVKTDMSKAFDRVEWSYLKALLVALGFHPK